MTVQRHYGNDTPFGVWIRDQKDLDSHQYSFTCNDVDYLFHKYRPNVDGIGTRDVQLCMFCEIKTLDAKPRQTQQEILFYHHQLLHHKKRLRRIGKLPPISVWHFGVFVLRLPGEYPKPNPPMHWGQFDDHGNLIWTEIQDVKLLKEILSFDRYPDTLKELSLRRHHKNKLLLCKEVTEIGIPVDTIVVQRS